jgi:hypothetical protein
MFTRSRKKRKQSSQAKLAWLKYRLCGASAHLHTASECKDLPADIRGKLLLIHMDLDELLSQWPTTREVSGGEK